MDSNQLKKYALCLGLIPALLMPLSSPASTYHHKKIKSWSVVAPYKKKPHRLESPYRKTIKPRTLESPYKKIIKPYPLVETPRYEEPPCAVVPPPCPCPCPHNLHDGWYEVINVGYDTYRVHRTSSLTLGGISLASRPIENPAGIVGGLAFGYGYQFPWIYLGTEVFGNVSNASTSSTFASIAGIASYSGSFNVRANYGASFLPGVMLNDSTLFYVRLGYNWAKLNGNETLSVGRLSVSHSPTQTVSGFNYGVGLESAIYCKLSLRGDFNHTSFNSFTSNFGTQYSASDNQFMLGLVYHFI